MGGNTKKHIKKLLQKFRNLRTWQFVLILIPLLFLAATFLRLDHIKMSNLKNEVLAADEANDDARVAEALKSLRDFTISHIVINIEESNGNYNTYFGTGPFYLENQYLRDANSAIEQAKLNGDSNPNGNIYAAASSVCQPIAISKGWSWNSSGYLDCMTSEIAKYPESDNLAEVDIPSTELYRYNFASPIWYPSLSGFTILICALLIVVIFIRLLVWLVLRIALVFLKK